MYPRNIIIILIIYLHIEYSTFQSYSGEKSGHKIKRPPPKGSCPAKRNFPCLFSRYYTIDGSCNNLMHTWWGKSFTPFERYVPARYDDGHNSPRRRGVRGLLPNPRKVAFMVHYSKWTPAEGKVRLSHFGAVFSQFFMFDAMHVSTGKAKCSCRKNQKECINIPTPKGDILLKNQKCIVVPRTRASYPRFNCKTKYREQLNEATHWFDLSHVYGNEVPLTKDIKGRGGLLKSNQVRGFSREFIQFLKVKACVDETKTRKCFRSGDSRVNEHLILTTFFTLFFREHNRLVKGLRKLNPNWSSETLYQEARRIVIAEYQKIVYEDYLPILLGRRILRKYQLLPTRKGYFMSYDEDINPFVRNEFATGAGRSLHTLIQAWALKADVNFRVISNISFGAVVLKNREAYMRGGLDAIVRGTIIDPSSAFDPHYTFVVQNRLFEDLNPRKETHHSSLSALDINRGRDHGIAPYLVYRKFCKLHVARSFHDLKDIPRSTIRDLRKVYKDVREIDLLTGLVSELPLPGSLVGPTTACIMGKQFYVLKHGDRLFFDNGHSSRTRFTLRQLKEIKKVTIARLICDNYHVRRIPKNPFLLPNRFTNRFVSCNKIPKLNLRLFKR